MIAKIVKGAGAKGIVDYILDRKKGASLIDHDGVLVSDNGSIARSFIAQSRFNPKVGKFIGHISLSFSEQDLPHLTDELMVRISREYMMKMGHLRYAVYHRKASRQGASARAYSLQPYRQ